MKHLIIFLSIMTVFVSCNGVKGPEKPENLIPKDQMVDILIDAKFIGTANTANKKRLKENAVNLDSYVYEKYKIDSLQFALSNNYYTFYMDEYEDIYTRVLDSLERLTAHLKALEAEEWKSETIIKEKDSLAALKETDSLSEKISEKIKYMDSTRLIKPVFDKGPQ